MRVLSCLAVLFVVQGTQAWIPALKRPSGLHVHVGALEAHRHEFSHDDRSSLPQTTLTLRHKLTKCEVTLVGCVHGAQASIEDVSTVINKQSPNVVVLELCESRYQHLLEEDKEKEAAAMGTEDGPKKRTFKQLVSNLQDFRSRYGILQTMLVALLSGSAEVQRLLTYERGCEFKTSIKLAKASRAQIVLGDQDLNVTLTRFKRGWGLENPAILLAELTSIRDAVVGPPGTPIEQRLNLFRLLFTQERYIKEILLIVVPLSFIVLGALEALDFVSQAALSPLSSALPTAADAVVTEAVVDGFGKTATGLAWSGMNLFSVFYLLGINRYILKERDIILASAIHEACRKNPSSSVIGVLGLLHVNGVARHLRAAGFE